MAVYFRGLTADELLVLTRQIVASGARLDFDDGGPPAVDKHSTGGVGDKVSLVLAPLLAESGLRVPMISGRGLAHTGGTLDKLESIPGFRTDLTLREFKSVLDQVGCAMMGQSPEIAPLDGRLYALRDVTATVPSVPLIAASIVSKKVAEGISALVLDVKYGRGAFFPDPEEAERLALALVDLAAELGLDSSALLTSMEEPLGSRVGNALEVREAIECLRGEGPPELRELTLALGSEAAVRSGTSDAETASLELASILDSGAALQRFRQLIERQGGDPGVTDDPGLLPAAPCQVELVASESGFSSGFDALAVGRTSLGLGAGRRFAGERVDPAVGIEILAKAGKRVEAGEAIARVHARSQAEADAALARLSGAVSVSSVPVDPAPLIWKKVRPGRLEGR
jgi:pyrimidine-nucleoside phosphorylase